MKNECLVCGKVFEGNSCPRCSFPVIYYAEGSEVDSVIEKHKPIIEAHRAKFFNSIKLGVMIYRSKDEGGKTAPDRKEKLPFGTLSECFGKELWLAQSFARIPGVKELNVCLYAEFKGETYERTVTVPNIEAPGFQYLGVCAGEDSFRVRLKNESEKVTESKTVPLLFFDEDSV